MVNKSVKGKVIVGIVAASLVLSVSGIALAKTSANSNSNQVRHGQKWFGMTNRQPENFLKPQLDSLVKAGTITQEQEDKISAYAKQKEDERKAEMDKIKGMTDEERKTYMENNKPKQMPDIFSDLVTQNIITQAQADAIKASLPAHQEGPKNFKQGGSERFQTQLDAQVKAGVITQEEEDKVLSYMKQQDEQRKAEADKIKNMTADERKAYMETKKSEAKVDIFDQLASQGILSQEKAAALKSAVSPKGAFGKDNIGKQKHFGPQGMQKQQNQQNQQQ